MSSSVLMAVTMGCFWISGPLLSRPFMCTSDSDALITRSQNHSLRSSLENCDNENPCMFNVTNLLEGNFNDAIDYRNLSCCCWRWWRVVHTGFYPYIGHGYYTQTQSYLYHLSIRWLREFVCVISSILIAIVLRLSVWTSNTSRPVTLCHTVKVNEPREHECVVYEPHTPYHSRTWSIMSGGSWLGHNVIAAGVTLAKVTIYICLSPIKGHPTVGLSSAGKTTQGRMEITGLAVLNFSHM